jgi:hypothetical protein
MKADSGSSSLRHSGYWLPDNEFIVAVDPTKSSHTSLNRARP